MPIRDWTYTQLRRAKAFARRHAPYLILLSFLLVFSVVFFFNRIVVAVQPGELGVLWRLLGGGTQIDTVYHEGVHFILPFNRMYVYNVRKQKLSDSIDVLTVDGLTVSVTYSVRYFLDKDTLPLLHQNVGPNYVDVVVRPEIRSVMRRVFGQDRPEEIYTTQKALQERINVLSRVQLEARFVALDDVPIESIKLPPKISAAIETKLEQQQVDGAYVYRLSIATKEAERRRIDSDGIKRYNDTVKSSLSSDLLAWHGILATQELANSGTTKVVVIGAGKGGLPLILGSEK
jgi:regulator of protease activity HflC (stomatin/prohibitin superfamily)